MRLGGPAMAFVERKGEIWRCQICGNVVQVIEVGGGQLICCGGPMTRVSSGPDRRSRSDK